MDENLSQRWRDWMSRSGIWAAIVTGVLILSALAIVTMGVNQNEKVTPESSVGSYPFAPYKVPRCVFWEDFTGWNCGPCANYNPYLEGATETYTGGYLANVAPSFLHCWWPGADNDPMHNSGNSAAHYYIHDRVGMYGVSGIPDTYIDGIDYAESQSQATIQGYFNARRSVQANITLQTFGCLNKTANTGYLQVHAECTWPTIASNLRLFCNLWENNITRLGSGGNGETSFSWAMWRILPDANGTAVNLRSPGDTFYIQYDFSYPDTFVDSELGFSVFIQDMGGSDLVEQSVTELFNKPIINILTPDPAAKDQVYTGTVPISWSAIDPQGQTSALLIDLDYSTNNGTSWTNIATGLANTPPYVWNPGTLDTPAVKLKATVHNTVGFTSNTTSTQFFSIDRTQNNRWFLQTQANFVGGKRDLDMKPMEQPHKSIWNGLYCPPATVVAVSTPSDVVVQSYASAYQAPASTNVAGSWNFSIYGLANASSPMPAGNLFARVYATDGVTSRLLFTTSYDDENIASFTNYHAFTWTHTAPSASLNAGERVQVDIVAHMTAATTCTYNWNVRGEFAQNGTGAKTGDFSQVAVQDGSSEVLREVVANMNPPLVSQNFSETTFPPTGWGQYGGTTYPNRWSRSLTGFAGGTRPEAKYTQTPAAETTQWRLRCGPVDTTGMTSLNLTWRGFVDANATGVTLRVQAANAPTGPWTNTAWVITPGTTNRGPQLEAVTITAFVGIANWYFCFCVDGNGRNLDAWYVDNVLLKRTGTTSALDHHYNISAPTGETAYYFSAYASRPASADNDNFAIEWSANELTWTTMGTVNTATLAWYNYTFPAGPGVPQFVVRVRDTVRTMGLTTISTVNIDFLQVRTTNGNKITIGYDAYLEQSYVDPKLTEAPPVPVWCNATVNSTGWNLISLPIYMTGQYNMPLPWAFTDQAGSAVQWDRLLWYNPRTPADPWKQYNKNWPSPLNDLTSYNVSMGVWISITGLGDGAICKGGNNWTLPTSTVIYLKAGWNVIGFPSNDVGYTVGNLKSDCPAITVVQGFMPSATYKVTNNMANTQTMGNGRGYWVYCNADATWTKAY
jgi:hypothetical protein